jgi:hypothetical protein
MKNSSVANPAGSWPAGSYSSCSKRWTARKRFLAHFTKFVLLALKTASFAPLRRNVRDKNQLKRSPQYPHLSTNLSDRRQQPQKMLAPSEIL